MRETAPLPTPLVSTDWLARNLGARDLIIIDASWRMPGKGRAREDYAMRHIPGAVFFDIDEIADLSTPLPHMLPAPGVFEDAVGRMGVSDADRVVIYDDQGLFSAARGWWTFRAMGHRGVSVLDGGLPKWLAEGRPTADAVPAPVPKIYHASARPELVVDAAGVRAALNDDAQLVLDARPAGRFAGVEPEPRAGLRRGRMPGAVSAPFGEVVTPDGTLKPLANLRSLFKAAGVAPEIRVITTCGSGVTAAVLSLALEAIGHTRHGLYDGSWAEWGDERNDLASFPVEAGAR